ncbi:glycosyl transferase family group 2-domain-containing protein [Xylariomycetidae sp. FL0641]|nr:glycosyl transferase family group 2-domain-containing protein [Xylariomycetidae sp. FL0641]
MGLGKYRKAKQPESKEKTAVETTSEVFMSEKPEETLRPPPALLSSSLNRSGSIRSDAASSFCSNVYFGALRDEVQASYIYQQQCSHSWLSSEPGAMEGVIIRKDGKEYSTCPPELAATMFPIACDAMHITCAMTVGSRIVKAFLNRCKGAVEIPVMDGHRIQVISNMEDLPRARKNQFAAFIASEEVLLMWDDDPTRIVKRAKTLETEMMKFILGPDEKVRAAFGEVEVEGPKDEEKGETDPSVRPFHLMNAWMVSVVLIIVTVTVGAAWRELAIEVSIDGNYTRLGLVALAPVQVFLTLFFVQVIVGCLCQIFGPISQMHTNSRYYSAKAPKRLRTRMLPHVTVQCPVYKEDLAHTLAPTFDSVKMAICTYELQGGSANIFVNDDGLQGLSAADREARIFYYGENSIGWVARPKHGDNGFLRRGKFKKASNMNYALMISGKVEDKLERCVRGPEWNQTCESFAYADALQEVLAEDGRAWADGNIRMGDYILIIDSDTRIPLDCLLDAVSEMEQSPIVGIMQFSSGVMEVTWTFFENGITFFTNLIYTAIKYTVSNGDVAPFVGHNAIIRWSALQQVVYQDEDGYDKYWSESHVSEDFDMSLRLQCNGYIIRLAAWAGDGFKEGVSLTVYDELARWEKYAYGCNELLFHPIRKWIWKGPFTPLFRKFLFSRIPFTSKVTIISYIGTYYAIGAAWLLTSANYFLMGWYNGYLDKYYLDSWKVWFSIIIVFNGLGNVALAVMRYRLGSHGLIEALVENFKWLVMLAIFLGGLSLHVSQALLCHMFEIDMTWGATAKEMEFANFFTEAPKILRNFKVTMIFALGFIAAMIILAVAPFIPYSWHITDFVAILPMATVAVSHFLLPLALNPGLMSFSW